MKIQLLSDLHIEFKDYEYQETDCDVVVLAGDIHVGVKGILWAIENIKDKPVIYVMGNHEFYGNTHQKLIKEAKNLSKNTNVHVLENDLLTIDGVNFLGCTLWTDFNLFGNAKLSAIECELGLSDYKRIRCLPSYSRISPNYIKREHMNSLSWIAQTLADNQDRLNVVITHHAPHKGSLLTGTEFDALSAGYVSNLEETIKYFQPTAWLHGHIHEKKDYYEHGCRIVCNPRGYPGESISSELSKIISILDRKS